MRVTTDGLTMIMLVVSTAIAETRSKHCRLNVAPHMLVVNVHQAGGRWA